MNMEKVILKEEIQFRIAELGKEISEFYKDKENVSSIILLNGAIFFGADLLRKINIDMVVDSIGVSSYSGTESTEAMTFRSQLKISIKDHHVLLVDDIFDTGFTVGELKKYLLNEGALTVEVCCLLDKKEVEKKSECPRWIGFDIENLFVIGYGLDCDEKYRNLEDIYVVKS